MGMDLKIARIWVGENGLIPEWYCGNANSEELLNLYQELFAVGYNRFVISLTEDDLDKLEDIVSRNLQKVTPIAVHFHSALNTNTLEKVKLLEKRGMFYVRTLVL